jgi:ATP-dependent Lhr-like helicase
MREGAIETTVVPRNPLDVLAQQIVAICAAAETAPSGAAPAGAAPAEGAGGTVAVDELYALVTRTHSYAELSRASFENVLDMLDGRYPSQQFAALRPRVVWDRVAGTLRARPGARQLAVTNAGTIPDRGNYMVTLPDGRRVGELDEEMVYEARPGQTFLLGASTWRIEEIGRDRVIVTPAPGMPGAVPFWKGDSVGRPSELGEAIGAFSRWAVDQEPAVLESQYDLDTRAARNLVDFLREQRDATRVLPSDQAVVLERFRDEIGDWRLCVLSPFGGRVHAPWALALAARIRDELGLEADAIWSDDGIIVHLPDAEDFDHARLAEMVLLEPEEVEELVIGELSGSALFGARFREAAGRALLIPRAYPGRRTPLWQQRLKAQSLLEVAAKYSDFPIVLETYRECLRDVFDLPALAELLDRLRRREVSLVEVETQSASPMASSLLFDYVATYMYEGDTPNAERRAAALSLDRDLLRELLGQEELRELIDPGALDAVEADLQWCSAERLVAGRDELHDMLRTLGDLSEAEIAARTVPGVAVAPMLAALRGERRAVSVRLGGEERWIAAADAGLYRDALGAVPPGGLPEAFLRPVPDALVAVVERYALTHGPFLASEVRARYGVDCSAALAVLERSGELVQGELRPAGSGREWCHREVLRRLRRASLAALRREVEPVEQTALARFAPSWQGVDRFGPAGAGIDRLRDVLVALQGLALPVELWESEVLPRRVGAYSPVWMDQLCAAGELVWLGAGALGRSGRVALYFRDEVALLAPESGAAAAGAKVPGGPLHEALRARLERGAAFFTDLLVDVGAEVHAADLQSALWDLVWWGEVTNDAFAPLRAPRLALARPEPGVARPRPARSGRYARRRGSAQVQIQGRWSLTAPLLEPREGAGWAAEARRARAELLLERHGVLTREQVLAEGLPGGFAGVYSELTQLEVLGVARRGYFVEGLGATQFALPGAVERLRERAQAGRALVLAALDPAQVYGAVLSWPARAGAKAPARVAGALVTLVDGEPVLYLERGGKGLQTLVDTGSAGSERLELALEALAAHVRSGRGPLRRVALERVDGEPAIACPLTAALRAHGFQEGPRRLTLSA